MKMDGSINCAREGCSKIASDLQCPVCQKNGLASKESSHFCSQECFRSAWASHKLLHLDNKNKEVTFNPWPNYKYTGSLRPYPYGPKRTITKGMRGGPDGKGPVVVRPDYADSGIPKSEMTAKSSNTIPVFLSNEEQDGIRIVCRVSLLTFSFRRANQIRVFYRSFNLWPSKFPFYTRNLNP